MDGEQLIAAIGDGTLIARAGIDLADRPAVGTAAQQLADWYARQDAAGRRDGRVESRAADLHLSGRDDRGQRTTTGPRCAALSRRTRGLVLVRPRSAIESDRVGQTGDPTGSAGADLVSADQRVVHGHAESAVLGNGGPANQLRQAERQDHRPPAAAVRGNGADLSATTGSSFRTTSRSTRCATSRDSSSPTSSAIAR